MARDKPRKTHLIVRSPDKEAWKTLVHDLKLNKTQANELWITIQHVILDLEPYRLRQSSRGELVERLKRMERMFMRLHSEIDRSGQQMADFLPRKMLMWIGNSLTFTEIGKALRKDVFPRDSDNVVRRMISGQNKITMEDLEIYYVSQRETLGLKHGDIILKHYIAALWAPLKEWVEKDKLNEGGRPLNVARHLLISRLADIAPELIGRPAPISGSGKFVELCVRVLPACGLSTEGIEKAVPVVIREKRARQRQIRGVRNE